MDIKWTRRAPGYYTANIKGFPCSVYTVDCWDGQWWVFEIADDRESSGADLYRTRRDATASLLEWFTKPGNQAQIERGYYDAQTNTYIKGR
jgi:hypothetical protein